MVYNCPYKEIVFITIIRRWFFHGNSITTILKKIFGKKKLTHNPPAINYLHCCQEQVLTYSVDGICNSNISKHLESSYQVSGSILSAFHTLT